MAEAATLRVLLDVQAMAERARPGEARSSITAEANITVTVVAVRRQGAACRDFIARLHRQAEGVAQAIDYRGCLAAPGGVWMYTSR